MDLKVYRSHRQILLVLFTTLHVWPCFIQSAEVVTNLPGFDGVLPFYLETGYVTVDEVSGDQMFYYFVESERNPKVDPVLLWLTGGPGCSSFTALAAEIGPLQFIIVPYNMSEQALPKMISNPFSWSKLSNIIFLDWPVGSGFSFSPNSQIYNTDDSHSSDEVHRFIRKWFMDHTHFMSNPFYLGGDSYGGKIVPVVAEILAEGNNAGQKPFINLKGYLVGNSATNDEDEYRSAVTYGFRAGIISQELLLGITTSCVGDSYLHRKKPACAANLDIFDMFLKEITMDNILDPVCPLDFDPWEQRSFSPLKRPYFLDGKYGKLINPPPAPDPTCPNFAHYLEYYWANNLASRVALHIKQDSVREWLRCNYNMGYTVDIRNTAQYHLNVTSRGYRALVYSGDHDMFVPFASTRRWIKSLNYSITDKWRSWRVDGQVAGYTEIYSQVLTFATVKGGGHVAPSNRPKECLAMFERSRFRQILIRGNKYGTLRRSNTLTKFL